MNFIINFFIISVLLLLVSKFEAKLVVFDISKYGARPSDTNAINQELLKVWKEACNSTEADTKKILIPKNTYALREIELVGPCKGSMVVDLQGILKAPAHPGEHLGDYWIKFRNINKLRVYGGGTFDGQGEVAWTKNNCVKDPNCKNLPMNIRFDYVNNTLVEAIRSLNSKNFHINILGSHNVTFKKLTILAPKDSPNTDGIHIGRSTAIDIQDTRIATGDDCISIGDGSNQIRISGVECGPGHGISIGSLGKYSNELPVTGVYVKKCRLSNTDNGVRIKTWPGMYKSTATDMRFEDITMENVSNPIIIDQMYCPNGQCNGKTQSNVKLSKITFKNIKGTSTIPEAIQLICSNQLPCEDVEIGDINLTYNGPLGPAKTNCVNVKPKISGQIFPAGCNK